MMHSPEKSSPARRVTMRPTRSSKEDSEPMPYSRHTPQTVAVLLGMVLGLVTLSTVTAAETTVSCVPTPKISPDQDIKFGACLFRSTTAFGQRNPAHIFASCNGCHPNGGTDRGVHAIMVTNS